jgi:hypothetical protein
MHPCGFQRFWKLALPSSSFRKIPSFPHKAEKGEHAYRFSGLNNFTFP